MIISDIITGMVNRSDIYWQEEADSFIRHYDPAVPVWKRAVGAFLDQRTRVLEKLLGNPKRLKVLDLGCGHGVHMKLLLPKVRSVTGIDYSREMVAYARKELGSTGFRNWKVLPADAHKLPFGDNEFDIIIAMGLFDYVTHPDRVLAQCHRVLKPGGRLIFTIPKKPSLFGLLRTSWGNRIKKKLFHLPPVDNILTQTELVNLITRSKFRPKHLTSLWTTMWMAEAVRN